MNIARLEIRTQLGIIALLVIVGFVAIGGLYWSSARQNAVLRAEQVAATRYLEAAKDTAYWAARAGMAKSAFLLNREEAQIADNAAAVAAARDALATMADGAFGDDSRRLTAALSAYEAAFEALVADWRTLGLDETQGLQGALRASVHAIEKSLSTYDGTVGAALEADMLMLRRREKDFMLRIDADYVKKFAADMATFGTTVQAAPIPPSSKSDIAALAEAYARDFNAYAALMLTIGEKATALNTMMADVQPQVAVLAEAALAIAQEARTKEEANSARTGTLIATSIVVVMVLVVGLISLIGVQLNRALGGMGQAMVRLSGGDLDTTIPAENWRNVVGRMAGALAVFKRSLQDVRRLEAERAEADKRAAAEQRALMQRMAQEFEDAVGGLVENFRSSSATATTRARAFMTDAGETSRMMTEVSSASTQATANVETVAAAAEELFASIGEISRQVQESSTLARRAAAEATDAVDRMSGLNSAAERVGAVVTLITDIASQTNLLALNATIEAARAGDAGKGFAVVANEVKALASQTSRATEEIVAQINSIQAEVTASTAAIADVASVVREIDGFAAAIASAIEEQSAATQEIARNVQEAADGTRHVVASVTEVSRNADRTRDEAGELETVARGLQADAATLSTRVGDFLAHVRAA